MVSRTMPEDAIDDVSAASPERRCIVSGQTLPTAGLIRFAVSPDGLLVPDIREKLPGRGLWLSADRNVVSTAAHKGMFNRAARRTVMVPEDLAAIVTDLLARRCIEIIGLSRRAGIAVAGLAQVEKALAKAGRGVLLVASDSGRDGRRRIASLAKGMAVDETLMAEELGEPFQRGHVTHCFVGAGSLARSLDRELGRLAGMRIDAGSDMNDNHVVSKNR